MFTLAELIKATGGILLKKNLELPIKGISIDSRTIKPYEAFLAIKGERFDGHDFISEAIRKGASCIIAKELKADLTNLNLSFIKVKDTLSALSNIARFNRKNNPVPLIAITGSNGKTTTKEMVSWILSERFNVLKNPGTENNIIGLSLALLKLSPKVEIAVLELGTNHFGEISCLSRICQPNIGIITNIGPSHLEFFKNLRGVFKEKSSLVRYLKKPKILIINADDPFLRRFNNYKEVFVISVGIKNNADFIAKRINFRDNYWEFFIGKKKFILKTLGYHNIYNALFSLALGRIFGLDYSQIKERLENFVFPQGRLKLIRTKNTNFLDDSYNANPASFKEALDSLKRKKIKGRKIVVMADMLELGKKQNDYHRLIGKTLKDVCDIFISIGELARLSALTALREGFNAKNLFVCKDIEEARDILFGWIKPNSEDLILIKGSRRMYTERLIS